MNTINQYSDERIPLSTLESGVVGSGDSVAQRQKPLVSIVLPAYNEEVVLEKNLTRLCEYMRELESDYRWEALVINDGSRDRTGEIADAFAKRNPNVRVYHHFTNFGLGQAFKFAFGQSKGDYVITMDTDLSYAPDHIGLLLKKIRDSRAKIVLASPYMEGGQVSNVPWLRKTLSIWGNKFLSAAAKGNFSTLTSMVRVYDGPFLRSLSLRSTGMDIMPETIHKAIVLGAKIEEVPAHLDWGMLRKAEAKQRRSSMRILRHILSTLVSGFLFRPVIFFILPGLAILVFALWVNMWTFIHFYSHFQDLPQYTSLLSRATAAAEIAYDKHTHTFVIGILSLMLSIQLISLGILSLQSKRYFEETFYLGSSMHRKLQGEIDLLVRRD
jgi:glycosyltransferase involved in cell wall biosynthesis